MPSNCACPHLSTCSVCDIRKSCPLSTERVVYKKPPLGVIPKKQWMWLRYLELLEGLTRYASEQKVANKDWLDELEEIRLYLEGTEYGKGTN